MASIRKRRTAKGDRWDVRYRDPEGKERTKGGFTAEKLAKAWAAKVEVSKQDGAYVDPVRGKVTLRAYVMGTGNDPGWLASQQQHSPGTTRNVSGIMRRLLRVHGDRPLSSITRSDIQGWVGELAKTLSPSSVGAHAVWCATVFKSAVLDGRIARTPCVQIRLPKVERALVVPMPIESVVGMANAIAPRYRALVLFAASTGLRLGELAGLTVDRLDLKSGLVHVERQWTRERRFAPTKTAASVRVVPIDEGTVALLVDHLKRFPALPSGHAFHSGSSPLAINRFHEVWAAARSRAGLTGITPHGLRHFYASLLIRQGVDAKTVQSRLGHKNISETMDTYGHLWPDHEERTRAAVASAFKVALEGSQQVA